MVLKVIRNFLFSKNVLKESKKVRLFTRYGMCEGSLFSCNAQEYMLLMSENFASLQEPILYVDKSHCSHSDIKYAQALKFILKEGGALLIARDESDSFDAFLERVGAKSVAKRCTQKPLLRNRSIEHFSHSAVLESILATLEMQKARLISGDLSLSFVMQRLGVELIEWSESISFEYGSKKSA